MINDALKRAEGAHLALQQYGPALHRYLRPRLRSPEDVRDLAQEVFMRYWQIAQRESIRNPQAFLYRLASNFVYEFRMREKRGLVTSDSELAGLAAEGAPDVWRNEQESRVLSAEVIQRTLQGMPRLWRAILLMNKREGLSAQEIAARLGISKKTVYAYLGYAIAEFRKNR
jgi:RNA polymerase sigma-70 factor (ECF subfamily)